VSYEDWAWAILGLSRARTGLALDTGGPGEILFVQASLAASRIYLDLFPLSIPGSSRII